MNEIVTIKNKTAVYANDDISLDPTTYVSYCTFDSYCVPEILSCEQENAIYGGDTTNATKVGTVNGMLVMGSQAKKQRIELYGVCDSECADLEYMHSALSKNDGPLTKNKYLDIFFIDSIKMNEGYDTDEYKEKILEFSPEVILAYYNIYPDIICDYIPPLASVGGKTLKVDEEKTALFALYKRLGFIEHSNTGFLYKVCNNNIRK